MEKLFVQKSIEINAPPPAVWETLTDPRLTREWISEWWPEILMLESEWKPRSPVIWKLKGGAIGAEGKVLVAEPPRMLSFTFKTKNSSFEKQESITYQLRQQDGHTLLTVLAGDFGDNPRHQECYAGAVQSWEISLAKIKALTEEIKDH
jgi:uncharacterized protein YndB with AHSA1/START domain